MTAKKKAKTKKRTSSSSRTRSGKKEITIFEKEGSAWVRFQLHPLQRDSSQRLEAECPLTDRRWVRSSSGKSTLRPVIRTRIGLGGRVWRTEITLVRRDMMGFRMLLGRQAIRRRFLVHCGKSFMLSQKPAPTSSKRSHRLKKNTP